jgi:addiction module RelE/StbE family toxin
LLTVIWRPHALTALSHIIEYIADSSPATARRLRQRILQSVEPARSHPEMFRIGRIAGTWEIVAHPNYLVIYEIHDAVIEVMDVVHARREYP